MADVLGHSTLPTNLVSYWELEESSGTRLDSFGFNDLTDNATVGQGTGKQGSCADFEASNSEYLSITDANQDGLDFSDVISMAFWFKPETHTGDMFFIDKAASSGTNRSYFFKYKKSTNKLQFASSTTGASFDGCNIQIDWTPSDATWYHIVVTKNGTALKMYVDGSQLGSTGTCSSGTIHDSGTDFVIGRSNDASGYVDGLMDEVAIWSKELTSTEVTDLYNSGTGLPFVSATDVKNYGLAYSLVSHWELEESSGTRADSHGSNPLGLGGSTPGQGTGKQGNCIDFEEADSDRLYLTDASQTGLDITSDMSASAWINLETASADQVILSKHNGLGGDISYSFFLDASNNISLKLTDDGSTEVTKSVSWSPSTATWYHLAFSFHAATRKVKFFVDGAQQGATQTSTPLDIYDSAAPFQIGARLGGAGTATAFFDGLMDEVSVWNRTISLSEVEALYNSGDGIPYDENATTSSDNALFFAANF